MVCLGQKGFRPTIPALAVVTATPNQLYTIELCSSSSQSKLFDFSTCGAVKLVCPILYVCSHWVFLA